MTPDEWTIEAAKRRDAQRPKQPRKRAGATPEAKVKKEVETYLAKIGALSLRTGAGLMTVGSRKFSMGRSGCSDLTVLLPGGFWLSVETKSATGTASDPQERFLARVEALGGLAIVARGKADVRAALVQRFGEGVVAGWER